jgi:hypothetical protein
VVAVELQAELLVQAAQVAAAQVVLVMQMDPTHRQPIAVPVVVVQVLARILVVQVHLVL